MKRLFLLIAICASWTQLSYAQITLGHDTTVAFATIDEGKQILTARDDFVRRMSPFDRAARLKTGSVVSEREYLEFVGKSVLAWNDAEKQRITSAWEGIQTEFKSLSLPFPKQVFMIKTTGNEEGGAAYTRANAIVFPKSFLARPPKKLQRLMIHELFHILSRTNPDLCEKFYASIGFAKCNEVVFPPNLKSRKLTNPDAPKNNHCIRLQIGDTKSWAIPILFSSVEKYDTERGGEFFNYLQFQFLLVERDESSSTVTAKYAGKEPRLVGMKQVSEFFEQVGRNTGYTIHPEEILADNFALLVLRKRDLPSPEIVEKMEKLLKDNRIAEQRDSADAGKPGR